MRNSQINRQINRQIGNAERDKENKTYNQADKKIHRQILSGQIDRRFIQADWVNVKIGEKQRKMGEN